ncbi:MAG: hypothetical protein ABIJ12_07085 [bacterium]
MKRLFFLGILISLGIAGISLMSGCSDDDNSTGPVLGDTSSAKFQFIDSTLGEEMFEGFGEGIDLSLELLSTHLGVPLSGSKDNPIMALQTDEGVIINSIGSVLFTEDFWWVFTFEASFIDWDETTYVSGTDSVQLLLGTSPLESYVGELTFNAAKARAHVSGYNNEGQIAAHHRMDVAVDEAGSDSIITVSGTTRDTLNLSVTDGQSSCDLELTEWLTLTDLEILVQPIYDDCLQDGSISLTATIDLSCTGGGDNPGPLEQLDIEGPWTITAVINDNGTATITFTDGTTTWRITKEIECS